MIPLHSPPHSLASIACSSSAPTHLINPAGASPNTSPPSQPPPTPACATSSTRPWLTPSPDHTLTEQALAASPLTWTVLRNNLYTDYLIPALGFAVATGKLNKASGNGAIAYVTREDCARAAAAALASNETRNRTLDVTGSEALTPSQLAALTTKITSRSVAYVPVPADGLRAGLNAAGLPAALVEALVTFDLAAARGELQATSSTVAELTGRAPTTVADFLTAHRAQIAPPLIA
jgi:NAD(P)H dehydrogenase (quinone)